jgi:hypothetical protein
MIVRTLKKKVSAEKTLDLIFNKTGHKKNFKQLLKLLKY